MLSRVPNTTLSPSPFGDPSWRADALSLLHKRYPPTDPEATDCDSDHEAEFVKQSFPRLPFEFSEVATPTRIKVVVFDVFGVILVCDVRGSLRSCLTDSPQDREGAIRTALTPWTMVSGCTKDATLLTRLYIESEALINHDCSTQPISFARVVYSALLALAERLGLSIAPHSRLFTDTFMHILTPARFVDAEPALTALADRGVKLICFPPYSSTTLQHYTRVLPPAFHKHVELAPLATPVHFAAGDKPWWQMYAKCKQVAPNVRDDEILVVSAGVGRVLVPALEREYATTLLRRPDSLESHVDFIVGERREHNPVPLMTVGGLMELCATLKLL